MLQVVGPMLLLFGMVTGVIYSGIATPTEASALGAFGAFGLAIWKGKINLQSPAQRAAALGARHLHDRDDPVRRLDLRLLLHADPGDAKPGGLGRRPPGARPG